MPQAKVHIDRDDMTGHYVLQAAPGLGYGFRWDADADGKPDSVDFGEKKSVELSLGVGESRNVKMEVKNAFGRTKEQTITVTRPKPDEASPRAAEMDRPPVRAVARREVQR